MLYIGYFSFDQFGDDGRLKHGYFSSIVDADRPSDAVAGFEKYIRANKNSQAVFDNIANIYIEEILRVSQVSKTPIITRLQSCEGEFPASVSHSLPGYAGVDVESFGLETDVKKMESADEDQFSVSEPFIRFDV